MELAKKVEKATPEQQIIVNSAVLEFNKLVTRLNEKTGVAHPHLARPVHHRRHGHWKHVYTPLWDGLHLDEKLMKYWAQQFINVFPKNSLAVTHYQVTQPTN